MEAYIANFDESLQLYEPEDALILYFSGSDFKGGRIINPALFEFCSEHLVQIKEIKQLITPQKKKIILAGGEPLLQRQAIAHISHLSSLPLSMYTHCSKPEALMYLMSRFVEIHIPLWYPLTDEFATLCNAGTFFKPADMIMEDIRQAYRLLASYKGKITLHVYAHEQFKEKQIYEHTQLIPWHEMHLYSNSDYFHGFDFFPVNLHDIQEGLQLSAKRPVIIHDV